MEIDIDFGELSNDENFKKRLLDFRRDAENAAKMLETLFSLNKYDQLSIEDKVRYDLFVGFALNTFFWAYLRTKGVDPNQHELKSQINRIREYMSKSKKIYERKTLMPRIDQGAAKRFIRGGLWMPPNKSTSVSASKEGITESKKRKREDCDE